MLFGSYNDTIKFLSGCVFSQSHGNVDDGVECCDVMEQYSDGDGQQNWR